MGRPIVEECLFLASTSRGFAPLTAYFTEGRITAQTYLRYGTERQKDEILGGMCRGRLEAIALRRGRVGSPVWARRSSKLCAMA